MMRNGDGGSPVRAMLAVFLSGAMLGLTLWGMGCAGHKSRTQPGDMSAEEHRREAARHAAEAQEYAGVAPLPDGGLPWSPTYGRKPWQITEARSHSAHAREHLAAAEKLERFEGAECHWVPLQVRPYCPLLIAVDSVEEIPGGVRVRLVQAASVEAVLAHMRCHQAVAAAQGYADMEHCALYLKGVTVSPSLIKDSIDIIGDSPETVAELRRRVAEDTSSSEGH